MRPSALPKGTLAKQPSTKKAANKTGANTDTTPMPIKRYTLIDLSRFNVRLRRKTTRVFWVRSSHTDAISLL